jgi:plasmid stabilization system protein ParE
VEKISWTPKSKESLSIIWEFYSSKSERAPEKIIGDIIDTVENIHYDLQYQQEIPLGIAYRRAISLHFKIIYRVEGKQIIILDIFDSRQDPNKLSIK